MSAPAAVKNNRKAAQIRQEGNRLFLQQDFDTARAKYHESICWAENDSEDLAIGYANLSAVFFEMKEYEFTLANIALAKKHNYPERLMPKLAARENQCHRGLNQRPPDVSDLTRLFSKLDMKVEVNPRIPFLSKDVRVDEIANGENDMIANRDFRTGEVILEETSLMRCLNPAEKYNACDNCMNAHFPCWFPCRNCVSVMYCSEECREKSWNHFHRFECDISEKLHIAFGKTKFPYIGPRLFFYGLGLFKDDVEKMMEFCKAHPRTGSNPLSLDYVKPDPLEEFKAIHTAKQRSKPSAHLELIAFAYYKAYKKNALVQSLFTTKDSKVFMRQCFADYLQALPWQDLESRCFEYFTIASYFQQYSEEQQPNVTALNFSGKIKLVSHHAIPKGTPLIAQAYLGMSEWSNLMSNACSCTECRVNPNPSRDYRRVLDVLHDRKGQYVPMLIALQQYVQKYSHLTGSCLRFAGTIDKYRMLVDKVHFFSVCEDMRARAKLLVEQMSVE